MPRTVLALPLTMGLLTGCNEGATEVRPDGVSVTRDDGTVVVSSSAFDLPATAVAVEWEGAVPRCLESGGVTVPAQEERTRDGRTRLWTIADVPAGESRVYTPSERTDCASSTFAWEDVGQARTRLLIDGIPAIEYVYPAAHDEAEDAPTRPFHHVYAPDGSRLLTKGGGGNHPHHQGIFHGYRNIGYEDTTTSTWGSRGQEHARTGPVWSGPVFGGHEVTVSWVDEDGNTFAEDRRTVRAYRRNDGNLVVDVESELTTLNGPLRLGGDPHHAGLQFRAPQYVYDNQEQSSFVRPEKWADFVADEELNDAGAYVDSPWNALRFVVDDEPYMVGYFSHPTNSSGGQMSERLYGRFGEYIPNLTVEVDRPVRLHYRFLVAGGHEIDSQRMEREYLAYTSLPYASQ